jgi:hypothetical protein
MILAKCLKTCSDLGASMFLQLIELYGILFSYNFFSLFAVGQWFEQKVDNSGGLKTD